MADQDLRDPTKDEPDRDGPTPEPDSVDPDDPLAMLRDGLAPPIPDIVREARRNRAREALFGKHVARQLGRYIVLGELGRGGMGTVLTAYDPQLDRKVALKLLHDPQAERHAARLEREAKALAKLSHPNVVQVYEVGLEDDQRFVAMELVQGQTLRQWQSEPRPWKDCVQVYLQAGRGLAAAHAKGLVHRDFKPGNCILDDEGRVRVLDFGLVYGSDDSALDAVTREAVSGSLDSDPSVREQTKTGTVLGTPAYMPPEQLEGRQADARSDQFSFCVALFEAVYGERPFEGGSVAALTSAIDRGQVRPVPQGLPARVPAALRTILVRGLAGRSDDRWPSMETLLGQLQRLVVPRARRWALISLTVGVLGVGGGLALGRVVEELERCTDAHRRLTNIWDDGRRQQVKAAILATGLGYAPGTWERLEQRLDDYADAWASKHTEVCEASTADAQGEEDRRLRLDCMHERSRALRAAVDVLAQADEEVVEHAVGLAAGLPGFGRCDDLDALRAVVPPPEDPEVRREVEALREQLADIEAAQEAGKYIDALEEAEPVVERAEAMGYGPLVAEAKARRGRLRSANGRYAEAEEDLLEAHEVAMEHRHDEVAMRAAQALIYVVGKYQARHAEGRVWGRVALAHAKRSGEAVALADSLSNLGNVFKARGEYEQARRHFERALRMDEQALGADHPNVAMSLNNLGAVLEAQGEYEQARRHFERALRIWENALGADHPQVAQILNNLGIVLWNQGEHEQARRYLEQALRIWENALGADHPNVAMSLDNLGAVLEAQGEYEQAQLHVERALRTREKALGADHPDVARSLNNLGIVHWTQGEYEQAQRRYERALRIQEKALGADHPDVAASLHNLGTVLAEQGEYEQAQRRYERASRIVEKALGVDHPDLADSLIGVANVTLEQQDFDTARANAERAVSIREKSEVAPELLAEARFVLARALWPDPIERPRARTLTEQARDAYAALGEAQEAELVEVQAWLAEHRLP